MLIIRLVGKQWRSSTDDCIQIRDLSTGYSTRLRKRTRFEIVYSTSYDSQSVEFRFKYRFGRFYDFENPYILADIFDNRTEVLDSLNQILLGQAV